jgi:hypothetical protein
MLSRRALVSCALATATCAPIAEAAEPTLSAVVARHTKARGGAAAIDAINSERAEIAIEENGSTLNGIYQCGKEPFWRIDVYDGSKHVFCEGLDGAGPWLWPQKALQARDAVPDAKRTGLQGIEFNMYGLHRFSERGHRLSLDGREAADGTNYFVIHVLMKDAYETYLLINPATWLIDRRRDFRAFHPDYDATRKMIDKRYSDYRSVAGVQTAFVEQQYDMATGKLVNASRVKEMAYNYSHSPQRTGRSFRPA